MLSVKHLAEAARAAQPRTADDVSITWDGRRLDSREKVLEFLAELETERAGGRDAAYD